MILYDSTRRWAEIRFYILCTELYQMNNDMLDVITYVETICYIGRLKIATVKPLVGKILQDFYYMPTKEEIICLSTEHGVSRKRIADFFNMSTAGVQYILKNKKDIYTESPKLEINEDEQIVKFLEVADTLKKAGI